MRLDGFPALYHQDEQPECDPEPKSWKDVRTSPSCPLTTMHALWYGGMCPDEYM